MIHQKISLFFPSFLVAALVVLVTGCAPNNGQTPSSYDQANEHIEQGHFESAISLMRDVLRKNPKDQKARVILASAFAARAGLYVTSYMDLAQDLIETKTRHEQQRGLAVFQRLRAKAHSTTEKDLIDTLDQFNRALWVVSDVIQKFEKIPEVQTKEQYADLKAAAQVLQEDSDLHAGPLVYRGVLKLVLFRYHLKKYYRFPEIKDCQVNLTELSKKIRQFHAEVRGLLFDFTEGSTASKQTEKLQAFTARLDQTFSDAEVKLSKHSQAGEGDLSLFLIPFGVSCP